MHISTDVVYTSVEKTFVESGYSVRYLTSLYQLGWLYSVERNVNLSLKTSMQEIR